MKIVFWPRERFGKAAIALFVSMVICVSYFLLMVNVFGQRGGQTFFSNLNLSIPMLVGWLCGLLSFVLGTVVLFKHKVFAVLLMLTTLISFLTTLYGIGAVF